MKYQDAKKIKPGDKFKRKVYAWEFHSRWNDLNETYTVKNVLIDDVKREAIITATNGCFFDHKRVEKIINED